MMQCPKCKNHHTHRSHRHGWIERSASLAGYYPYNCSDCQMRFLHKRNAPVQKSVKHQAVEREMKATREALKAKRKRRELLLYSAAMLLFLAFLYYITHEHGTAREGGFAMPGNFQYVNAPPVAS